MSRPRYPEVPVGTCNGPRDEGQRQLRIHGASMSGKSSQGALRDRILAVATDLFIRHGYKGVSFLGIAKELGISHSHIHYYFGTKALLAEAVVNAYVAGTTAAFRCIWTTEAFGLLARFVQSRDWIWQQYVKFNPDGVGGQNWGLLARFALEADLLAPTIRKTIRTTLEEMESFIETGIDRAIQRGELSRDAPRHALVLQVSSLLHTSQHITRIEGNFQRLEELLKWTFDVIQRAYGTPTVSGAWPAVGPARSTTA